MNFAFLTDSLKPPTPIVAKSAKHDKTDLMYTALDQWLQVLSISKLTHIWSIFKFSLHIESNVRSGENNLNNNVLKLEQKASNTLHWSNSSQKCGVSLIIFSQQFRGLVTKYDLSSFANNHQWESRSLSS